MENNFEEVVNQFNFSGDFKKIEPYGHGHINDTFAVYFDNGEYDRYILQRINECVFKDPVSLMENIENVTEFLKKIIESRNGDFKREALTLIETNQGKKFYKDSNNKYWRGYIFIEKATTYMVVEKPEHLYQSGKAFGAFQNCLRDFPAEILHETIVNFHNTKIRFENFEKAIRENKCDRVKFVSDEIKFVMDRKNDAGVLVDLLDLQELPLRVTHNDTKFNNVMIDDNTGEAVCVIDLDTVMPGLALYDFGDAIRSGTNPVEEDEIDVSKVFMDNLLYENFTKGFLEETKYFLTEKEIEMLPFSAKLMTYECGMRFLTDYLSGDVYFKISRENHNLDRARTQFAMVKDMENKFEFMKDVVAIYSNN